MPKTTETPVCRFCNGNGYIVTESAGYGSRWCDEPYTEEPCGCEATGR